MTNKWKDRLPQYMPPEHIWERIRQQLAQSDSLWRTQLEQLPEYAPPESVWRGIAQRINSSTSPETKRIRPFYRGIAAAIALWCIASVALLWHNSHDRLDSYPDISWSTQTISEDLLVDTQALSDSEALKLIWQLCQDYPFLCNTEEVQSLKTQLQEVAAAKRQLSAQLTPWETDPELLHLLTKIEREEAHLIRQMVAVLQ